MKTIITLLVLFTLTSCITPRPEYFLKGQCNYDAAELFLELKESFDKLGYTSKVEKLESKYSDTKIDAIYASNIEMEAGQQYMYEWVVKKEGDTVTSECYYSFTFDVGEKQYKRKERTTPTSVMHPTSPSTKVKYTAIKSILDKRCPNLKHILKTP